MQTRRKSRSDAWIAQLSGAAELPLEVQQHILQHVLAGTVAAADAAAAAFRQLDRLRRVSQQWNHTISCSPPFLALLRAEKFCSMERRAWDHTQRNSKRLPSSFTLPFLNDSSGTICNVQFKVNKTYKRASAFVVEAKPSTLTPQQAVTLLQTMCELEGARMAMLLLLHCPADSPNEWLQHVTDGAGTITHPTTVNVFTRADGVVMLHPKNEQYKCWVKPKD